MLTLSQILVVHNGRYSRSVHSMRRLQLELREMDTNLHSLMMQNVPSIELNRRLLQNQINSDRIRTIIRQASVVSGDNSPHRKNQRQHYHMLEGDTGKARTHRKPSVNSTVQLPSRLNESARSEMLIELESYNQEYVFDNITDSSLYMSSLSSIPSPSAYVDGTSDHQGNRSSQLDYCPSIPPTLTGKVHIDFREVENVTANEIWRRNPAIQYGGRFHPPSCLARHKVAIIIPYRDREEHLITLLNYLHPLLQRQQLDYTVFVIEQFGKDTFNKARIMNIAFVEALKRYHFQCFVFHDVDLVPEDDRNMYSCPTQPRHMSVAIDEMGYKLAYPELVGGVLNVRGDHFQRLNGYSNLYWGWGAEDDDMAYRILHVGLKITRPPETVARYRMIRHMKRKPADWRKRAKLLYTGTRRFQFDGLNSLQYNLKFIKPRRLYTHMMVDIGRPPRGF